MKFSTMVTDVDSGLFEWMREIRRRLHQYPELSYQETKTSVFIQDKLDELGISYQNGWGGTGVIASLGETPDALPFAHVGLRADMDALPLEENNRVIYASMNPGVMHACGHDGHVAMLLGAAALLKKCVLPGKVSFIFQPAEEDGNGARKLVEEGALSDLDAIFAGHIDVHYPTGTITVDEGLICSFADPFSLSIKGSSGHAARPHEAKDAIVAGAFLVTAIQTLVSRDTDPNHSAVVTVGCFQAGRVHNVIADSAVIDGTIRCSDSSTRLQVIEGLKRIASGVSLQYGVEIIVTFKEHLPAVINSRATAEVARNAAKNIVGGEQVISQGRPSLGGEDFAFYQQVIDGCLVRFGADSAPENGPAHSPNFDFDEEVLRIGAAWLANVAVEWLANGEGNRIDAH